METIQKRYEGQSNIIESCFIWDKLLLVWVWVVFISIYISNLVLNRYKCIFHNYLYPFQTVAKQPKETKAVFHSRWHFRVSETNIIIFQYFGLSEEPDIGIINNCVNMTVLQANFNKLRFIVSEILDNSQLFLTDPHFSFGGRHITLLATAR